MHTKLTRRHKLILLIVGLILIGWLLANYHTLLGLLPKPWFTRATLIHELRGHGLWAALPLVLLLAVVAMIPGAPSSVVAIVAGVCLGAPLGFVVNVIGISLGNNLGALVIDHVESRASGKNGRLMADLTKATHPKLALTVAYAVPFVPNALAAIAAAKLQVTGQALRLVIIAASVPTAFLYAFGGDAVLNFDWSRLIVALVLIGVLALAIRLLHRHK